MSAEKSHYIKRHWKGELSLAKSFWINYLLLFVLYLPVSTLFLIFVLPNVPRFLFFPLATVMALVSVAFFIWQIVGVWRAATTYDSVENKSWGKAAKGFVIVHQLYLTLTIAN